MVRHKLALVSEDKLRKQAKDDIVSLVHTRFSKGKDTSLQDIQNVFQKNPYALSEGSVINYLEELVNNRKLSTWKVKNRRYYGPPQIPFPIKVGIATSVVIITLSTLIDSVCSSAFIYEYIYLGSPVDETVLPSATMLPLALYLLVLTAFFTVVWHMKSRNVYK